MVFIIKTLDYHLGERCYQLPISHGVGILPSHRPCDLFKVVKFLFPVSLENAGLPHCQRGRACVAEGTQVQVPGITGAAIITFHTSAFL